MEYTPGWITRELVKQKRRLFRSSSRLRNLRAHSVQRFASARIPFDDLPRKRSFPTSANSDPAILRFFPSFFYPSSAAERTELFATRILSYRRWSIVRNRFRYIMHLRKICRARMRRSLTSTSEIGPRCVADVTGDITANPVDRYCRLTW